MNLSLCKLRGNVKLTKAGQGNLIGVILAGVIGSVLVSSITTWYLSMRQSINDTEDKLESQTIALHEWDRISHMSLDELDANRNTFKTPYLAGKNNDYSISINLGEKGAFYNGVCGTIGSDGYSNCIKNTTITEYHDGNKLFTTRTLPVMSSNYTSREIDNLLSPIKTDYNNKINNLTNKLNSDYYSKSQVDSKLGNLIRLEDFDKNAKTPAGKALYTYLNGNKLPLAPNGYVNMNNAKTYVKYD